MPSVEIRIYFSTGRPRWEMTKRHLDRFVPPILVSCTGCADCTYELFGIECSHQTIDVNFWGLHDLPERSRSQDMVLAIGHIARCSLGDEDIAVNDLDHHMRRAFAPKGMRLPKPLAPIFTGRPAVPLHYV
jgi:hypothetical protein